MAYLNCDWKGVSYGCLGEVIPSPSPAAIPPGHACPAWEGTATGWAKLKNLLPKENDSIPTLFCPRQKINTAKVSETFPPGLVSLGNSHTRGHRGESVWKPRFPHREMSNWSSDPTAPLLCWFQQTTYNKPGWAICDFSVEWCYCSHVGSIRFGEVSSV